METKARWDCDVPFILGVTFLFIGIVYLIISFFLFAAPEDADDLIVSSIFISLGAAFFLAGSILLLRCAAKKRRSDRLLQDGRYIWGTVTELRQIHSINSIHGHPYRAVVAYTDGADHTHRFESRCLHRRTDPALLGKPVKVYIANSRYAPYYVDIDPALSSVFSQ